MPRAGPSSFAQRASSDDSESSEISRDSHIVSDDDFPDAPRVARWVDEEELDEDLSQGDMEFEEGSSDLMSLKRDLSKLPMGALVKAHRIIKTTPRDDGSDDGTDSDSSSEPEVEKPERTHGAVGASALKHRRPIEHRSNKHAPMEVTSKKPVPRRRQVIEVRTVQPRDPRFSDLSGSLSQDIFRSQYGFLSELHTGELATLKQSLARAHKLLLSSPQHLREEREEEVNRLELAVKRAESIVNREKREQAERKALGKLQHEEKEKRKAGKKGWWLKDADKKAVRVRARMDAIAESGGKRAVKKAIEKKQRKVGQKEKKSRPFAPPPKRPREENRTQERRPKRRRTDE